MSLTKEAIDLLKQAESISSVARQIGTESIASSIVVVPDGFNLKDLECYKLYRDNYRGKFSTNSIDDFVTYCQEFDQEGAKCFIDANKMSASAALDLGTKENPLHQNHSAVLSLQRTAAFISMLSITSDTRKQKMVSDFIEDWSDNIVIKNSEDEVMSPAQAAKRVREITIEQVKTGESNVGNFGNSMSNIEKIEAKNQESIPATIFFTCDPYHGLENREFKIKLSILTGGDKPEISLRIIRLEAHQEDMAKEFKGILIEALEQDEIKTLIGSF